MDDDPQQERHVWCVLDSVVKISSTKRKEKKKTKNQVIKPTRKKKRKLAAKKSGGKKQHQQQAGSNSLMKGIEEVQLTPNTFPLIQCHQLRRDSLNFSDVYLKTR